VPTVATADHFEQDKLFWSLSTLGYDEKLMFNLDPMFNFRVFEDSLRNADRKDRSRISQEMLRRVTEMALVDEIRVSVVCERGWDRHLAKEFPELAQPPGFREDFIRKYVKELSLPESIISGRANSHLRTFWEIHGRRARWVLNGWRRHLLRGAI
jgi:hypothetical protein